LISGCNKVGNKDYAEITERGSEENFFNQLNKFVGAQGRVSDT